MTKKVKKPKKEEPKVDGKQVPKTPSKKELKESRLTKKQFEELLEKALRTKEH